ncbi:MAG: NAD(P)H-dependent oxidoreductase [Tepidisphaeraceae bacterium]
MPTRPILIVSGTNRPASNTRRISEVLAGFYRQAQVPVEALSLTELPAEAFLPESYASKPASVQALQQRVLAASGLHIVTPEYNGSFPGVLKYFIDLLKFPESFIAKPVAFTGLSAGLWGALRSVEQLAQVFSYRNAHLFPDRVFIPQIQTKFDTQERLSDADIAKRLETQAQGFAKFVDKVSN